MPVRTVGPMCARTLGADHIDKGTLALQQSTPPGPAGVCLATDASGSPLQSEPPMWGQIPVGTGLASVVRIPIPGTNGLAIELQTRDPRWAPRSSSSLFFQDPTGQRHLRLDYGYNKTTRTFDYHWNQEKGAYKDFGISNHTPAGPGGRALYQFAKYFRYAGRLLLVAGAAADAASIVVADRPMRRASQVVSAWAVAWIGCKATGALGAYAGTAFGPGPGTAIGGIGGCIVGGIAGYAGGSALGATVYDWAEGTQFTPLPQVEGDTR